MCERTIPKPSRLVRNVRKMACEEGRIALGKMNLLSRSHEEAPFVRAFFAGHERDEGYFSPRAIPAVLRKHLALDSLAVARARPAS